MSFKLLAIRPLKGCNPKFLKNLKEGRIYKLYNDYKFFNEEERIDTFNYHIDVENIKEVTRIKYKSSIPENLYYQGNEDPLKINISAIVGKNGSGKSAIIELMTASIVRIALQIDKNFIVPEYLYEKGKNKESRILYRKNIKKMKNSFSKDLSKLNIELYYYHENPFLELNENITRSNIRKITIINEEIFFSNYFNDKQTYNISGESKNVLKIHDIKKDYIFKELELYPVEINFFKDLFYNMIINYSHYGYNTEEMGEWLKGVFHKNDGYQLPIVINPYRNKGNIDINIEKELARSRFLVNILQKKELRVLSENKIISHITISLDYEKLLWNDKLKRDERINISENEKEKILQILFEEFYGLKYKVYVNKNNFFYHFALDYVLNKLRKITHYPIYNDYEECFYEDKPLNIEGELITSYSVANFFLLKEYIESLSNDSSHNTDKLRQALFFLRYTYIDKKDIQRNNKSKTITIDFLSKKIEESYSVFLDEVSEAKIRKYLGNNFSIKESLPSFFNVEYFFENKISNNNFSNFSSGEKQKIFSIHSVIYHLRNLKSVQSYHFQKFKSLEGEHELITYKNINIVFDEIELYAHPEYQREFVKYFLESLKAVYKFSSTSNLNIIFITHSPFILSDIPKQNVLFLDNGEPKKYQNDNTFAENIHEMLTDGFFITSTKGEFAVSKVHEFLKDFKKWIDLEKKSDEYLSARNAYLIKKDNYIKLISLIGEKYLRTILEGHLDELDLFFLERTFLDIEEDRLKKRLNEINILKQNNEKD